MPLSLRLTASACRMVLIGNSTFGPANYWGRDMGGGNIISGSSSPTSVLTTFSKAVSGLPYVSFTIFGELICGVDPRVSSCESNFGSDLPHQGTRFRYIKWWRSAFLVVKCIAIFVFQMRGRWRGWCHFEILLQAYDIFCFSSNQLVVAGVVVANRCYFELC